jgi:hypothetical protein
MFGRETSFLELAVYVACESEGAVLHEVAPSAEDVESGMRFGLTIKRQAVSIESHASVGSFEKLAGLAMSSNDSP